MLLSHRCVYLHFNLLFFSFLILCLSLHLLVQMGSRYKKSIVSENVRRSIRGWKSKALLRRREGTSVSGTNRTSSMTLEFLLDQDDGKQDETNGSSNCASSSGSTSMENIQQNENEISPCELDYDAHQWEIYDVESLRDQQHSKQDEKDSSYLLN